MAEIRREHPTSSGQLEYLHLDLEQFDHHSQIRGGIPSEGVTFR